MKTHPQIRKAALVASVMRPKDRQRLLSSLEPAMAGEMVTALKVIARHGWDRCELVQMALQEPAPLSGSDDGMGTGELCELARQVDSVAFSRILVASGKQGDDFLLTVLDPDYAVKVRAHLQAMPEMPPRLRAATAAVAMDMLESRKGRG